MDGQVSPTEIFSCTPFMSGSLFLRLVFLGVAFLGLFAGGEKGCPYEKSGEEEGVGTAHKGNEARYGYR